VTPSIQRRREMLGLRIRRNFQGSSGADPTAVRLLATQTRPSRPVPWNPSPGSLDWLSSLTGQLSGEPPHPDSLGGVVAEVERFLLP